MTVAIAPINRTYEDAMALLIEARNYVAYRQREEEQGLPPKLRVRIGFETLRVTTRLTQSMAWLLAQRAVQDGELTQEAVGSEGYTLDAQELCLDDSSIEDPDMPDGLRSLSERSLALYRRIDRLDRLVRAELNAANDLN